MGASGRIKYYCDYRGSMLNINGIEPFLLSDLFSIESNVGEIPRFIESKYNIINKGVQMGQKEGAGIERVPDQTIM